jgi:serine phosphatase RsbU (regulator of sigma subunit)
VEVFDYPTERRQLLPGEWLCVVTDGATEAMNAKREFFGLERLRASLSWIPGEVDPEELLRRLRDDLKRFTGNAEPADDITLLSLRWDGARSDAQDPAEPA